MSRYGCINFFLEPCTRGGELSAPWALKAGDWRGLPPKREPELDIVLLSLSLLGQLSDPAHLSAAHPALHSTNTRAAL